MRTIREYEGKISRHDSFPIGQGKMLLEVVGANTAYIFTLSPESVNELIHVLEAYNKKLSETPRDERKQNQSSNGIARS